jgi:phosphoribosylformimino-5-aminoimidazole carboxamide ribotide isomerase
MIDRAHHFSTNRWLRSRPVENDNRRRLSIMTIYPAIDIKGGRGVRLLQGRADQETVYFEHPADAGRQFRAAGSEWVHVVDLDGAFGGEPVNLDAVKAIAAIGLKVQLGGGLRTLASVERAFGLGVSRVVIGTRAAESAEFVGELVRAFGDRIAVDTTGTGAIALAQRMDALGVATIIYTDIGTDGMMTGPNLAAQEAMCTAVKAGVIASGGVAELKDVAALRAIAARRSNLAGVIIGKAIYEKRFTVESALLAATG